MVTLKDALLEISKELGLNLENVKNGGNDELRGNKETGDTGDTARGIQTSGREL